MELRRNIYKKLIEWKEAVTGNILELSGARQVGKTYILKKFGKENFKRMIYINMVELSGQNFLKCISMVMDEKPSVDSFLVTALKLYEPAFIKESCVFYIQKKNCWMVQCFMCTSIALDCLLWRYITLATQCSVQWAIPSAHCTT